jgi:hypothetical protein
MEELPDPEALWKAHLEQEEKRREAETSGAVTTPSSAKRKVQKKTLLGTELPAVTAWVPGQGERCSKNVKNEWQCKNTAIIDRKWCPRCTAGRQRAAKSAAAPQTEAPPNAKPAAAARAALASQATAKPAARIRKIIPTKKDLLGQIVAKTEPPRPPPRSDGMRQIAAPQRFNPDAEAMKPQFAAPAPPQKLQVGLVKKALIQHQDNTYHSVRVIKMTSLCPPLTSRRASSRACGLNFSRRSATYAPTPPRDPRP